MSILLVASDRDLTALKRAVKVRLGEKVKVWIYPEHYPAEDVEMAVIWKQPPGLLSQLPNLKLVSSLGAGVEHILSDEALPERVRVVRIVEEQLTQSMRNYLLMTVLLIHKQFIHYLENQPKKVWQAPQPVEVPLRIGMLGLGALGERAARALTQLGFSVQGYSRRRKEIPGVRCYGERDISLMDFFGQVNCMICLLPHTPQTENLLDYSLLRHLPPDSYLINVGRGEQLVEADLIRALEEGILRRAILDVFRQEPLPPDHPFWAHPQIVITPHVASITNQENAATLIADNYRRLQRQEPLRYEVDRKLGY